MDKILVDVENNKGKCDWNKLSGNSKVVLFISDRVQKIECIIRELRNNWTVEVIYVYSSGINAMDHAICEYIWKDSIKNGKTDKYIIISGDHGFDDETEKMNMAGIWATRNPLTPEIKSDILIFNKKPSVPHVLKEEVRDDFGPHEIELNDDELDDVFDINSAKSRNSRLLKRTNPRLSEDIIKMLEETPLTDEEMKHPVKNLGKRKREECRQVLASKGIPMPAAKRICRSMTPQTAQMVIEGEYNTSADLEKMKTRINNRLSNIGYSDSEIEKSIAIILTNAKVLQSE